MRVVFDTNVIISALITEGFCSKLLRRARLKDFSLVLCPFILNEIKEVLSKKFKISQRDLTEIMKLINEAVDLIIEPKPLIEQVCKDATDDNIIACAYSANADYLVTGDAELIALHRYKNVKIISPRDFERMLDKK